MKVFFKSYLCICSKLVYEPYMSIELSAARTMLCATVLGRTFLAGKDISALTDSL
jgi:hypothetical protein